jgi:hypothetical protein
MSSHVAYSYWSLVKDLGKGWSLFFSLAVFFTAAIVIASRQVPLELVLLVVNCWPQDGVVPEALFTVAFFGQLLSAAHHCFTPWIIGLADLLKHAELALVDLHGAHG